MVCMLYKSLMLTKALVYDMGDDKYLFMVEHT